MLLLVIEWIAGETLERLSIEKLLEVGINVLVINITFQSLMPFFSIDGSNND